ncbi:DUF1361 domain-containing protein [Paenibacillus mucilaginosus]|uniref:Membrane protein n=2 Tax=Paenibacillus mucilaginosus TaxID=61624 RepID=F8FIC0_PAEMK|nr:membrane protein [Paenibacillus mucilaginosus KNP414]WDM26222.1 DUF1361 domain-containing protein [Paenibacillus mucilaginosus]
MEGTIMNLNRLLPWVPLLTLLSLVTAACLLLSSRLGEAYDFLRWDVTLAWIPVPLALLFLSLDGLASRWVRYGLRAVVGPLWLAFFPNSAYLVTELLHAFRFFEMQPGFWTGIDYWYRVMPIFGVACLGLALSTSSLYLLHRWTSARLGALTGWFFAAAALALASFGVYIGRILRWNSWDLAARPRMIVTELAALYQDTSRWSHAVSFVELFFAVLFLSYGIFYTAIVLGAKGSPAPASLQ